MDVEILVIDGGSTDGTPDMLRAHGDRLRWISEPDNGVYDAMNKGVARARGRWLLFLGAGDRLRPGVLARVAPRLPRNTLAFVYGNALMHDKGVVWDGPWTPEKFRTRNICHQAIFYGRAVFSLLGKYDTRFRVLADYEMNMRCFAEKRVRKIFIDEVISDYEGGGFSAVDRDEVFYEARPALLQKHFGIATKKK
jgi:glycosyltransferase involved in cell wall biosynthesis